MTTLAHYRGLLRTNKHRLDEELEAQAELQDRIAQEANLRDRDADRLADELKRIEGRLAADAKASDPKLTVDQVGAKVRRDRERLAAWERWQEALHEAREWSSLLEAWKVKGFTLRDLGALYGSDYFSLTQTSVGGGPSEGDMRRLIRDASRDAGEAPRRRRVVDA